MEGSEPTMAQAHAPTPNRMNARETLTLIIQRDGHQVGPSPESI